MFTLWLQLTGPVFVLPNLTVNEWSSIRIPETFCNIYISLVLYTRGTVGVWECGTVCNLQKCFSAAVRRTRDSTVPPPGGNLTKQTPTQVN